MILKTHGGSSVETAACSYVAVTDKRLSERSAGHYYDGELQQNIYFDICSSVTRTHLKYVHHECRESIFSSRTLYHNYCRARIVCSILREPRLRHVGFYTIHLRFLSTSLLFLRQSVSRRVAPVTL